jgi:hypothetical protein
MNYLNWLPFAVFYAPQGSVVLRRWKSKENGIWCYGILENWQGCWVEYGVPSEFAMVEKR